MVMAHSSGSRVTEIQVPERVLLKFPSVCDDVVATANAVEPAMSQTSFNTSLRKPFHHGVTTEVVPRARVLTAVIERQGRRLLTQQRSAANPFFAVSREVTARWPDEATNLRLTRWPVLQ
jgi:hypothetical protein